MTASKKIYISHSTAFNFKEELYKPIIDEKIFSNSQIILPHEASNEQYDTLTALKSGDIKGIIAEVSFPSTGQGIEIGWANFIGIPLVCIHRSDKKFSSSLNLISKVFIEYENVNEIGEALKIAKEKLDL